MALKHVISSLDGVPDALKSHYVQKDGRFVLDVEGAVPADDLTAANAKITEFRDTNVKLLKALGGGSVEDALKRAGLLEGLDPAKLEKLKSIDPDEYARLKAMGDKLGAKDAADVDARITAAVEAAVGPLKSALTAEQQARASAQEKADKAMLRSGVGDKFLKAGGRAEVLDFIMERAPFRVVDGEIRAADNKYSSTKPGEPLSVEEWLAGAAKEQAWAFEPSKGGGADPAKGNGGPRSGAPVTFRTTSGAEVKSEGIVPLQQ